jgi:hypothetical protein
MVEQKLESLGYEKTGRNTWVQKRRVVHIMHSSDFGRNIIRIKWREEWKNDYAIIYDYSWAGGPVCIVPVKDLFMSDFVKEKRMKASYANSRYWWTQKFPLDHELGRLVLNFKERWDLLY